MDALAALWRQGWEDGHAGLLPETPVALRTAASFRDRVAADPASFHVVGPTERLSGLYRLNGDALEQFYIAAEARGTGLAATLLAEAEMRLAEAGVTTAWLACAIGNERAARFYEKNGWRRAEDMTHYPETTEGPVPIQVWRYEKTLAPLAG